MLLKDGIERYKLNHIHYLHEIKNYYEQLSLLNAIEKAALARNPTGKMNEHQYRVGLNACKIGVEKLVTHYQQIEQCITFMELFQITEYVKSQVVRLGDLWSYDTALKIGFNMHIYPADVFIQAGVIKGARKLLQNSYTYSRTKPLNIFPEEMQCFEPYEAENFLCIWGKD